LLFTLFPFQNCISIPNLTRFLFVQANYHKFSTLRETKTDSAIFLDSTPNFIRSRNISSLCWGFWCYRITFTRQKA